MMRFFSSRGNEKAVEPARKARKQSLTSSPRSASVEFEPLVFVDIPEECSTEGEMSERDAKEYIYETYKEEILDRMRIVQEIPEEAATVSTDETSTYTRRSPFDLSFHSSQSETLQELTFVKQRLELLQKVALAQKQYLQCEGPKVVYTYLLEGLLDLVESEFGFIGEVKYDEDERMYLHVHRATNIAWDEATKNFYEENEDNLRFYNMDTLFGRTLLEKKPLIHNARATKTPDGHPFIEAFMGIPFFSESNEVIGMLGVANKPGGYDNADVEFLDPFSATCGNIIQSYRQIEKNKELIDTLELKVHERTKALEVTNQELEEANRKVNKAKEMQLQHFACMSHEIRTPLNGIVGLLSLLQETELSPSQQESINLIVSSSDLLSTVVNDVLDYSKLETGHVDFKIHNCRLQDTLNSVLHSFRTKAASKNISLVADFGTSVPTHIDTDSQRLQQCLFNLMGNAIKFSEENSKVELTVTVCDDSDADVTSELSKCPMATARSRSTEIQSTTNKETLCPVLNAKVDGAMSGCPFHKTPASETADSSQSVVSKDTFCPVLNAKGGRAMSGCPFHQKSTSETADNTHPVVSKDTFCPVLGAKKTATPSGCPFYRGGNANEARQSNQDIERPGTGRILRFVVKDYGRGIKASDLDNIFKPFQQADAETEAQFGGTGLGLAITDKLVRGLGGKMSVKSRIGEFSEFTIDFPLVDRDAPTVGDLDMPIFVVHHSDDDEAALHLKKTFDSSNVNAVVYKSMKELQSALVKYGGSMRQEQNDHRQCRRRFASCIILCHEALYDEDCCKHLMAQVSDISLCTFGPDFLVMETDKHFPFLSHTLPTEILQSLWTSATTTVAKNKTMSGSNVSLLSAHSSCTSLSSNSLQQQSSSSSSLSPSCRRTDELSSNDNNSLSSSSNAANTTNANASLRVLVAEDNKINRKVISNILRRIGVTRITLVENGQLAVEAEANTVYDCILMDMQMPVMGGVEACRIITNRPRKEDGERPPVVVFVTANVSPSHEKECNEAGGQAFLPKPFNVKKLEAMFDNVRELLQCDEER